MTLGKRIVLSQTALVIGLAVVLTLMAVWRAEQGFRTITAETASAFDATQDVARQGLLEGGAADLTHQAQLVYAMCATQQELLEQKLSNELSVARHLLQQTGAVKLANESVSWKAVNPATNATTELTLPKLVAGDVWMGQNATVQELSPIVDEVKQLVGDTCTVFQRMNPAGDMLRVCTNVQKKDGTRAIGTYIPAQNADGSPNPVVAAVLRGDTYGGRAMVVDRWYVTAYEPVKDAAGDIIGMLYVGVPEDSVAGLREAIIAQKVGTTGYVYVINAKGESRGHYVISQGGKRDGEDVWETKDADGKPVIQEICARAAALAPGTIGEIRYSWKNANDTQAREKIVKLAYFAPWDWVIGVGAYMDEFCEAANEMDGRAKEALAAVSTAQTQARSAVIFWCTGAGLLVLVVAVCVALLNTRSITKPLKRTIAGLIEGADQVEGAAQQLSASSQELAEGASTQASSLEETSSALEEMAAMTRTSAENARQANEFVSRARQSADGSEVTMDRLNTAMTGINESSGRVSKIIKVIEEIAFQTNLLALNAAVEAARAGEHGKGFAVVAEEVRNLAQRCAAATKETTNMIDESVKRAKDGTGVAGEARQALHAIATDVAKVADLLNGITQASQEQSQGADQINAAVSQMDRVTQQNAAGAEESASAAEQLSAQSQTLKAMVGNLVAMVSHQRSAGSQPTTTTGGTSKTANQKPRPKVRAAAGHRPAGAAIRQHSPSASVETAEPEAESSDGDWKDF